MEKRKVEVGKIYRHFKGTYHKVLMIGKHSETLEDMVVYNHEDTSEIWIRPYASFIEKVDKKKYPNVSAEYRFECVEDHD